MVSSPRYHYRCSLAVLFLTVAEIKKLKKTAESNKKEIDKVSELCCQSKEASIQIQHKERGVASC